MSIDVNGNDNTPEWGWCHAEDCKEGAFPIWKSGDYPDDPDLLLCPKHIGALIFDLETQIGELTETVVHQDAKLRRAEADAAAMRDLVRYVEDSIDWDNQAFSLAAQRIHAQLTEVLTSEHPGDALTKELHAARAVANAARNWSTRETSLLPIDKGDTLAAGAVIEALRAYDIAIGRITP